MGSLGVTQGHHVLTLTTKGAVEERSAAAVAVRTSASAALTSGRSPRTTAAAWQTGHQRQSPP